MKVKNGDIILLLDGRMLEVLSSELNGDIVQFVDRDESSMIDLSTVHIEVNLKRSDLALMSFYSARSVHLRLNKINKI